MCRGPVGKRRPRRKALAELSDFRFCLLEPEFHLEFAENRHGCGEALLGILLPPGLSVEHAKAEMAASYEGTHFERLTQSERLPVASFRYGTVGRFLTRAYFGEETQGPSFVSPLLLLLGKTERASSGLRCPIELAC